MVWLRLGFFFFSGLVWFGYLKGGKWERGEEFYAGMEVSFEGKGCLLRFVAFFFVVVA